MRKMFVIAGLVGILTAGAATSAFAEYDYTNFDGSCDPGDTVNPPGTHSGFHCHHASSTAPDGTLFAKKAAFKQTPPPTVGNTTHGAVTARESQVKSAPASKIPDAAPKDR